MTEKVTRQENTIEVFDFDFEFTLALALALEKNRLIDYVES